MNVSSAATTMAGALQTDRFSGAAPGDVTSKGRDIGSTLSGTCKLPPAMVLGG